MSLDAPEDQGLGATQMHDAAIAAGLVPRPERIVTDDEYNLRYSEEIRDHISEVRANRSVAQLEQACEEEEEDEDEDEIIQQIRKKRMQELREKREARLKKKQELTEVDPLEFDSLVRQPSRHGFVLLVVYRPTHGDSELLLDAMRSFSMKHAQLTCLQMRVSSLIANLPPQDCPVLLVYHEGRVIKQWARLEGLGGKECNVDVLEWELGAIDVIDCELDEDPLIRIRQIKANSTQRRRNEENDSDEDSD